MKILVTGGAGFIGSNLVHLLLAETGHHVVTVDKLTYAGNLSSLGACLDHDRHHFAQVDLCDPAALRAVFDEHQPEAVLHLAAESHVDRSIDGPAEFINTNVLGTFHLLEAARACWAEADGTRRFLHVSTDEVYGSLALDDPPFSEQTRYDPHSPYSASKAASDHLARAWHDTYGLPVVVTNCSNNYGPYQFPEKLVPVVILKCLRGEEIPVYGTGANIRDWLYVEDHCRALLCALENGTPGATYTIGGANELTNLDLVRLLCGILDERAPRPDGRPHADSITFVADRPGHDLRYAIDSSRLRTDLGWTPREDAASGFRRTVDWYLDHRAWWEAILDGSYRLERAGLAR